MAYIAFDSVTTSTKLCVGHGTYKINDWQRDNETLLNNLLVTLGNNCSNDKNKFYEK